MLAKFMVSDQPRGNTFDNPPSLVWLFLSASDIGAACPVDCTGAMSGESSCSLHVFTHGEEQHQEHSSLGLSCHLNLFVTCMIFSWSLPYFCTAVDLCAVCDRKVYYQIYWDMYR